MALPVPYDGTAGVSPDPAESEAENLYANYRWVFRLAHEMNGEAVLNLKRAAQLALHCRKFMVWFDALKARIDREGVSRDPDWPFDRRAGEVLDTIRGVFEKRDCEWPTRAAMRTDLIALRDACVQTHAWMEANQAEYRNGFTVSKVIDADGNMTDEAITIAKPAAFATRVAAFRALFA